MAAMAHVCTYCNPNWNVFNVLYVAPESSSLFSVSEMVAKPDRYCLSEGTKGMLMPELTRCLRIPGFCLCKVLIASPLVKMNNWVLNVAPVTWSILECAAYRHGSHILRFGICGAYSYWKKTVIRQDQSVLVSRRARRCNLTRSGTSWFGLRSRTLLELSQWEDPDPRSWNSPSSISLFGSSSLPSSSFS